MASTTNVALVQFWSSPVDAGCVTDLLAMLATVSSGGSRRLLLSPVSPSVNGNRAVLVCSCLGPGHLSFYDCFVVLCSSGR